MEHSEKAQEILKVQLADLAWLDQSSKTQLGLSSSWQSPQLLMCCGGSHRASKATATDEVADFVASHEDRHKLVAKRWDDGCRR